MKTKKQNRGFTIIESLVAIAVVLVGVAAAFSAAQLGLFSSTSVRNRVTAVYLAQEAMEGVKNVKDSNVLKVSSPGGSSTDWLEGLDGPGGCPGNQPCGYDILDDSLFPCSNGGGGGVDLCHVYIDANNNNIYHQSNPGSGVDTGFIREIYVTETDQNREAEVRVVVTKPGSKLGDFELVGFIYNWF